jgi:hypothetical protein
MSTVLPTELQAFHQFLNSLIDQAPDMSPEQSVEAFRAYQADHERLREEVRPALERSLRGESEPLDMNDIKSRGRKRMAQRGLAD